MKMGNREAHDEFLELLPWFVNNSLVGKERIKLMAHLSSCAHCRSERDQLQQLQSLISQEDTASPDYVSSFQKLKSRIELAEENRSSTEEVFPGSRRDVRWPIFATAASLLLGIFILSSQTGIRSIIDGSVGGAGLVQTQGEFETLSLPMASRGVPHFIELSFQESLKPAGLRDALIQTQSNIVSGPDAAGRYIVRVSVPEHMTDQKYLQSIQAINGVEYAAFYTQLSR